MASKKLLNQNFLHNAANRLQIARKCSFHDFLIKPKMMEKFFRIFSRWRTEEKHFRFEDFQREERNKVSPPLSTSVKATGKFLKGNV